MKRTFKDHTDMIGRPVVLSKRITRYFDLAKKIESVEETEIQSLGKSLELIKDIGDASVVADQYSLNQFFFCNII